MTLELLTSRKNQHIRHFRALIQDRSYRREQGLFVCDGLKLLHEAEANGAEIEEILCCGRDFITEVSGAAVYGADEELFRYVSPLENSPGPLFTVRIRSISENISPKSVLVLENVQDPGNVGTVLRTAAALGTELVVLCGGCADPYNPKTVRATMGAIFRQKIMETDTPGLNRLLAQWELPLYGAALAEDAADARSLDFRNAAVAVGNEGHGLSPELLELCTGKIILPMTPGSESLNAAVAASILMWEMARDTL